MAMPYMDPQYTDGLASSDPGAMHKLHDMRQAYYINTMNQGFMHAPLTWMTPQMAPFLSSMSLPTASAIASPMPEPPSDAPIAKKAKTGGGKVRGLSQ